MRSKPFKYVVIFGVLFVAGLVSVIVLANTRRPGQAAPGPAALFDTDQDGLSDADEERYKTSITESDSDFDGLTDAEEIKIYKTDPTNPDSDGDGFIDGVEVLGGYNPLGAD